MITTDLQAILTRAAAGHDLEELHRAAMAAKTLDESAARGLAATVKVHNARRSAKP